MTRSRSFSLAILVALSILFAGCGFDNVTENEAAEGWRAASQPLQQGQQAVLQKVEKLVREKGKPLQKFLSGEKTITHVTDCHDSGDVKFSVSYDVTAETGSKVDAGVEYRACEGEVRIETNGELGIDSPQFSELSPGGESEDADSCDCPEPRILEYEGQLDWSGKVDGPCALDLTVEIPPWGRPSTSGDLCGYEASKVLGGF